MLVFLCDAKNRQSVQRRWIVFFKKDRWYRQTLEFSGRPLDGPIECSETHVRDFADKWHIQSRHVGLRLKCARPGERLVAYV